VKQREPPNKSDILSEIEKHQRKKSTFRVLVFKVLKIIFGKFIYLYAKWKFNLPISCNSELILISNKSEVGQWLSPFCLRRLCTSFILTFMGPCVVSIFQYISNKMQRYTVYLYLETALHVSVGTSTHHQERIQLYLQHLLAVTV
jgi:hypothetical protein